MIELMNVPSFYASLYEVANFCAQNRNDDVEILVPDKLSLFMEKFIYEQLNISSSFNIKVSTLNRYAKRNLQISKDNQISKVGSIILIHKILNTHFNEFEIFKNKAYSFSYAEEIFKTISQLKSSQISFEEMKVFKSNNLQLNNKIKDLAVVYEYYENEKAGKLDASDMFLLSTQFIGEEQNKKLIFAGFDDFTAIEYAIIERLALNNDVIVMNYFSNNFNKHIYNREVYEQLKNIAYLNELNFKQTNSDKQFAEDKNFLQENLYSIKNNELKTNNEFLTIFSGKNIDEELEFVARDIKLKTISGKSYDNFGVAVYNLEANIEKINEIFAKYDLNFYLDCQLQLNKSILYKFWCSVLKYNLEGYSLTNLIDIINSPFLCLTDENKQKVIEKFKTIGFRGQINENFSLDVDNFDVFKKFIISLTFKNDITLNNFLSIYKEADINLNITQTIDALAQNKLELKDKILLTKSHELLENLMDEIVTIHGNVSLFEFYDIFNHVANSVKFNNLPLTIDAIKVVEAENNLEIFDTLYIVNCTAENAPMLKYDCGIILDEEIENLTFKNKLSPTIAHINKLAKLRLYNLLTMYEKNLILTYSYNASEVIKQLANKIKYYNDSDYHGIEIKSNFNHDLYLALSKSDYLEFLSINDKNNTELGNNLLKNKNFNQISDENLKIYNNLNTISASRLESYFHCPFAYFISNVLKINPKLDNEIMSLDVGNILHEILYSYYKHSKQVGDIYEFCKKEVFKYVDANERLKFKANSPILANLIDEALRVINGLNYIDENTYFKPKYFEYEFKDKSALKLKNIAITGKVDRVDEYNDFIRIVDYKSGQANAVLKELYYGDKLQLFLYSLAMEQELKKRTVGGFYLPLHNSYMRETTPQYSLKGFFINDSEIVHAMDYRLNSGDKSDIVNIKMAKNGKANRTLGYKELESDEMSELKQYAKRVSETAVDEIKSGYIAPSPSGNSKPCDYCEFSHICFKNSSNIKYRNTKNVKLESFKE